MSNKAIFLDRDGTINVDKDYVYKIEDLEIIPGVVEGLKRLQKEYKLIIVTNQAGITKRYYTKGDYLYFRKKMHKRLDKQGILITGEYFCPHISLDNCNCRKPRIGMLEQASRDFDIDFNGSWMIGDHLSDIQAGKTAGCRTIHILTGHVIIPMKEAAFVAKDMVEAADYILNFRQ